MTILSASIKAGRGSGFTMGNRLTANTFTIADCRLPIGGEDGQLPTGGLRVDSIQ